MQTLNVSQPEVEELIVSLILDRKIKGKIDQVNGLLVLDKLSAIWNALARKLIPSNATEAQRYKALNGMVRDLGYLHCKVLEVKVAQSERGWSSGSAINIFG